MLRRCDDFANVTLMGLFVLATICVAAVGTASQETPQFTASTAAVIVDVVVRDSQGRPVTNLSAADFEIFEGGTRQTVTTFQVVSRQRSDATSSRSILPAVAPSTASMGRPVESPTVTALVFEQLGPSGRRLARRAALEYVEREIPGGNFASIYAVDRALHSLVPYTDAVQRLRDGIEKAAMRAGHPIERSGRAAGAEHRDAGAVSQATKDEAPYARAHLTIDALERLVESMRLLPGRKAIVLFSEGFALGTPDDQPLIVTRSPHRDDNWLTDNRRDHFLQLLQKANDAHVAFYTFDAAGLRVDSPVARPGFGEAPYIGLQFLAEESGGVIVENTNDLTDGVLRVGQDLRHYYLLGYTPANPALDGKYREIRVKVKRPGATVLARKGYRASPNRAADALPDHRVVVPLLLLDGAAVPNAFSFRAGALAFPTPSRPGRTVVIARISAEHLGVRTNERSQHAVAAATVVARLKDPSGRPTGYVSEHFDVMGPESEIPRRELIFQKEPDLPPGTYTLEVIAYDHVAARASVRIIALEVPKSPARPLMSDLVVVDETVRSGGESDQAQARGALAFGDVSLVPGLGEPLEPESALTFGFTAYVKAGVTPSATGVLLRDGQALVRAPLRLDAPATDGRLEHVGRIKLTGHEPGTYQLAVTFTAGSGTATRVTTFRIARPLPPSPQ